MCNHGNLHSKLLSLDHSQRSLTFLNFDLGLVFFPNIYLPIDKAAKIGFFSKVFSNFAISKMIILLRLSCFITLCYIQRFHTTPRPPYWCSKTIKRQPYWCTKPILREMQAFSFVPVIKTNMAAGHVSWGFSQYKARNNWLVHGHMTSNKETVFRRTSMSGQHLRKRPTFLTSEGNSALFPASAR